MIKIRALKTQLLLELVKLVKPVDEDYNKLLKDFSMNSVSEFKKCLKKKGEELLVLKEDDSLLGVIKYKKRRGSASIESFYIIDEKRRGRGLGQLLYNSFEKTLRVKCIDLYAYKSNDKAIKFWEKNRFKIMGEDKDDKGEKMHYMKKRII